MTETDALLKIPVEQIKYQLTEEEFARGYEHYLRQNKKAYFSVAVLTLMILLFVNLKVFKPVSPHVADYIQFNCAVILAIGLVLFFLRKLAIYNTKKNLRISPFHNANLAAAWDEDTLSIRNDTGFQRYEWPKFRMWTQDDLIFTLFFGPHLFLPLPKRVFTESQQESLTAQLNRANIPLAKLMPF